MAVKRASRRLSPESWGFRDVEWAAGHDPVNRGE
jgi:hypothetical protein